MIHKGNRVVLLCTYIGKYRTVSLGSKNIDSNLRYRKRDIEMKLDLDL